MIFAQAADLVTWLAMGPEREFNPVVIALGPWAVVAKVALVALLVFFLPFLATYWPRLARVVRIEATVLALFAAATNVLTIVS